MNTIYRSIWSETTRTFVAVPETARSRGRRTASCAGTGGRAGFVLKAAAAAVMLLTGSLALAAPTGGQVASGTGSISQAGSTTTINQTSQNLALNWQTFNIAANETVNFNQPGATAIAVNRILDANGSQILGHLNANGQVWLINPNGVIFGQGAEVNVGGLVASALDLGGNANGQAAFAGSGTGAVVNKGTINAANGGYVAFIGNSVSNQGTIAAPGGTVALGGGAAVTLSFDQNKLLSLQVDQSTLNNLAANGGLIQANGGTVILSAGARDSILASAVNNTGIIEAETAQNQSGAITLLGGMTAGTVNVGGTLDASAPVSGNGGAIETSAAHVEVASNARVTTLAAGGQTGTWLLDPVDFTVAASGGDITGTALDALLQSNSITIEAATGTAAANTLYGTVAGSGNLYIDDAVSWHANTLTLLANNNVYVNAVMNATGSASIAFVTGGGSPINMGMSAAGTVNSTTGNAYTGQINFSGSGTVQINGTTYTVINSLGAAGSTTGTDLQGINGNLTGHYVLGSNIDATATSGWNAGAGFTPIGGNTFFSGVFDGFGHTVKNVTINDTTGGVPEDGLFGSASGIIRNVGLAGGSVTAASNLGEVGGLVGYYNGHGTGGMISNSYSTATVTTTGTSAPEAGGLVGYDNSAPMTNCYATGNVSATGSASIGADVGGLVGYDIGAAITGSYTTGNISSNGVSDEVGGLVGYLARATLSNGYATGNVSSTGTGAVVGGLVGHNAGTINNSYATGNLSNGSAYTGGVAGEGNMMAGASYSNDFYNSAVISNGIGGTADTAGQVYGMTAAQLKTQANFTGATAANGSVNPGWDFTGTWTISGGYPVLIALNKQPYASNNTPANNDDAYWAMIDSVFVPHGNPVGEGQLMVFGSNPASDGNPPGTPQPGATPVGGTSTANGTPPAFRVDGLSYAYQGQLAIVNGGVHLPDPTQTLGN